MVAVQRFNAAAHFTVLVFQGLGKLACLPPTRKGLTSSVRDGSLDATPTDAPDPLFRVVTAHREDIDFLRGDLGIFYVTALPVVASLQTGRKTRSTQTQRHTEEFKQMKPKTGAGYLHYKRGHRHPAQVVANSTLDETRPQHMLKHVKSHPIVHNDPLTATKYVTVGKKPWTGQIANHGRPNVGQPAFGQSCQACRKQPLTGKRGQFIDHNVLIKAPLYQ
ncbi:hypothetical protein FHL15_002543 [Xylaria flabelliformis]|uniref:Uncharacterized protein n=1 Tax=Xylaria flabelliformis TaxID=2512241 RepID=A0A553I8X4_9PEZI|nr:hypothetical protein FHL15_002543 [Xylaria flabelliformis]